MLNMLESVMTTERRAADALKALLEQVPLIRFQDIEFTASGPDREVDFIAKIAVSGRPHTLVCEVITNGQPRYVRTALLHLRDHIAQRGMDATPVLVSPYLSPEAQALCQAHRVGFLDLEGNARVAFDGVFIERQVATRPPAEKRELKSLFKPKSAQVLRAMIREPGRAWRVAELAKAADVSLGHVSNVRTVLLDREWARISSGGLSLSEPDALLDAWRDAYEPPAGRRLNLYTALHGRALEEASRAALRAASSDGQAVLASFSAAHWLAPYGRIGSQFFYADDAALQRLCDGLKLSPAPKGENVVVVVPNDLGLLRDTIEPAPGVICTSPVQTYLDLAKSGERGREAADHLRREMLTWPR
jgi:hypothetical protein